MFLRGRYTSAGADQRLREFVWATAIRERDVLFFQLYIVGHRGIQTQQYHLFSYISERQYNSYFFEILTLQKGYVHFSYVGVCKWPYIFHQQFENAMHFLCHLISLQHVCCYQLVFFVKQILQVFNWPMYSSKGKGGIGIMFTPWKKSEF